MPAGSSPSGPERRGRRLIGPSPGNVNGFSERRNGPGKPPANWWQTGFRVDRVSAEVSLSSRHQTYPGGDTGGGEDGMQGDRDQAIGGGRLHEDLSREGEIVGATDRGFGLTLAGVCGLVGAIRLALGHNEAVWWLGAAVIALLLALLLPATLAPLNRLWLRLGLVLYKVISPVAMGVVFFTTVVPIGVVMRAFGKDPLRLKRDPGAASYWIRRDPPGPAPDTMKNQF
jgi:hypothetical protein